MKKAGAGKKDGTSCCSSLKAALPTFQYWIARFFLVQHTKTGKNVPNEHEMYRVVIKYPKCP
jgi:hypothetical protein